MLGKIFGIISIIAFLSAIICGNTNMLGTAVLDGAGSAINLTISLVGVMCLWCGVLRVFKEAGFIKKLSEFISPFMRFFFPDAYRHGVGVEEISANIAANMLGVGNAATPFALSAMRKLQSINCNSDVATNDMITLVVLNTSSISIVPSTLLTLLRGAGSENPFSIIIPIWITSSVCSLFALVLCRVLGYTKKSTKIFLTCLAENQKE